MQKKGLTASFIIEAESANYSEGIGNITILKKWEEMIKNNIVIFRGRQYATTL
ncbi:hypothetical protein [Pectinatus cerevisiiphilus]|uniref:Uncharacterized protein n=1 Tax=Pectinatus cerevisiiphilus TaxID=86956 RepID=A0A4R3K3G0_9FIRM|nr:hypothetical protein [Pectinatus cerevisiiphilus]TCS77238.1 hypothetical protein EDC37_1179 [Pectinatus cerevisiiphilus]